MDVTPDAAAPPHAPRTRRAVVVGLGQFGGGLGATRHLVRSGAQVVVTDTASASKLAPAVAALSDLVDAGAVELQLGAHDGVRWDGVDLVVANPAIPKPWAHPLLISARERGIPVCSEINLLVESLPGTKVIAVTGSAGKSTSATLAHRALSALGKRSHLGGNIGGSLLDSLAAIGPSDWVVLELSSAMLWWLGAGGEHFNPGGPGLRWNLRVAALTNISANHIDWHGSFAHYAASKSMIRTLLASDGRFISDFSRESPAAAERAAGEAAGRWWECPENLRCPAAPSIQLGVPGAHQQRNARLAWQAARSASDLDGEAFDDAAVARAFAEFTGLEHRLQFVGLHGGLRCFNDSKATTPEATLLAIEAIGQPERIHLIAGGFDKGTDLSPIARLGNSLAGLYGIGATQAAVASGNNAVCCETIERAVAQAKCRAQPGEVLLLSPGCASWDQFTNFERRGERFVELVRGLDPE